MSLDEVHGLRSLILLAHFGLPEQGEQAHDALGDAQGVARVLQELLCEGVCN
ncbi:MAG: hypothetical protein QNJ09_05515 [Paracoccaceae bacterium]|nr:hypothetical protein [Paracoccaceae bacterium]